MGDSLLRAQEGSNSVDPGRQQRACGRVSVFPAPQAKDSKIGILGDELRETLGAKHRGEARVVARRDADFGWKLGRDIFRSFCLFFFSFSES